MESANSNGRATARDILLIKRLSIALLAIFIFTFAFHRLYLMYAHKFFDVLGPEASWIWAKHPVSRDIPIAFFATREFNLPEDRYFTKIKIAADPEYTLYFNGQMLAGRRGEDGTVLDVYDVSKLARTGRNRIVIAARSANGVGGVIAAVDTRPDFHLLATDSKWNIVRRWRDDLPLRDPPPSWLTRPSVLGRPPALRWNYLGTRDGEYLKPAKSVVPPLRAFRVDAALPDINVIGGVAVVGSHRTPGIAYEFPYRDARVRLETQPGTMGSQRVRVRFANSVSDLAPPEGDLQFFVFAPGERVITEPKEHGFRFVMVYGGDASAKAVQ